MNKSRNKPNSSSSASTKKSKKQSDKKLPSNPIDEKCAKLLNSSDKCLSCWKSLSAKGQSIINEQILPLKKEHFDRGMCIRLSCSVGAPFENF